MQTRILGKDLKVSAVGFGCMGLSHASGTPTDKDTAVRVLRSVYEMGYTFFDTAECYTGVNPDGSESNNEEIVGEALKTIRDKVVIATKFGVHHGESGLIMDSCPETIRKSVEGSLKRLGTDYIDLYYQHRIDPKVSAEEVAETVKELIKEGKVLHWGISEANEDYLRRAHAVCPITAIQNRYSMMARWHENLFPVLEELNIGYVAFSPMANGFLTAQYDKDSQFEKGTDYRSRMPQFDKDNIDKNRDLLAFIIDLARKYHATPAQISLAWMMNKKPYIVPIPGTRKTDRAKENAGAADIVLTVNEVAAIDKALNEMPMSAVFGGSPAQK
ncbi:MAG: aldo/keto reductase [Clostridiales bacterium]|nr:aldo/keto reductase [Clostridiales bacterium]